MRPVSQDSPTRPSTLARLQLGKPLPPRLVPGVEFKRLAIAGDRSLPVAIGQQGFRIAVVYVSPPWGSWIGTAPNGNSSLHSGQTDAIYQFGVLKMSTIVGRFLSLLFAIVFVVGVHGTEVLTAAQAQPENATCECTSDCACRSPSKDCNCSGPELTMKARCGCGGSDSQPEGTAPSWDTVFAPACFLGAPPLISSSAPNLADPLRRRLPYEHEHPPKPLP